MESKGKTVGSRQMMLNLPMHGIVYLTVDTALGVLRIFEDSHLVFQSLMYLVPIMTHPFVQWNFMTL